MNKVVLRYIVEKISLQARRLDAEKASTFYSSPQQKALDIQKALLRAELALDAEQISSLNDFLNYRKDLQQPSIMDELEKARNFFSYLLRSRDTEAGKQVLNPVFLSAIHLMAAALTSTRIADLQRQSAHARARIPAIVSQLGLFSIRGTKETLSSLVGEPNTDWIEKYRDEISTEDFKGDIAEEINLLETLARNQIEQDFIEKLEAHDFVTAMKQAQNILQLSEARVIQKTQLRQRFEAIFDNDKDLWSDEVLRAYEEKEQLIDETYQTHHDALSRQRAIIDAINGYSTAAIATADYAVLVTQRTDEVILAIEEFQQRKASLPSVLHAAIDSVATHRKEQVHLAKRQRLSELSQNIIEAIRVYPLDAITSAPSVAVLIENRQRVEVELSGIIEDVYGLDEGDWPESIKDVLSQRMLTVASTCDERTVALKTATIARLRSYSLDAISNAPSILAVIDSRPTAKAALDNIAVSVYGEEATLPVELSDVLSARQTLVDSMSDARICEIIDAYPINALETARNASALQAVQKSLVQGISGAVFSAYHVNKASDLPHTVQQALKTKIEIIEKQYNGRLPLVQAYGAAKKYLSWREENANGTPLSRFSLFSRVKTHWGHGENGEKRVKKIIKLIDERANVGRATIIDAITEAFNESGYRQHSFSRYLYDAMKSTAESSSKTVPEHRTEEPLVVSDKQFKKMKSTFGKELDKELGAETGEGTRPQAF